MAAKIFISYRRDDVQAEAGRLTDFFLRRFLDRNIFKDVETLRAGEVFAEKIAEHLRSCRVFIAVIGDNWVGRRDDGTRRIDDDDDWVRMELAVALGRGIPIVPVFVGSTKPDLGNLPEDIQELEKKHGAQLLSDPHFKLTAEQLVKRVKQILRRRFFLRLVFLIWLISFAGLFAWHFLVDVPSQRQYERATWVLVSAANSACPNAEKFVGDGPVDEVRELISKLAIRGKEAGISPSVAFASGDTTYYSSWEDFKDKNMKTLDWYEWCQREKEWLSEKNMELEQHEDYEAIKEAFQTRDTEAISQAIFKAKPPVSYLGLIGLFLLLLSIPGHLLFRWNKKLLSKGL